VLVDTGARCAAVVGVLMPAVVAAGAGGLDMPAPDSFSAPTGSKLEGGPAGGGAAGRGCKNDGEKGQQHAREKGVGASYENDTCISGLYRPLYIDRCGTALSCLLWAEVLVRVPACHIFMHRLHCIVHTVHVI
jgi:hypothetical protein